MSFKVCHLPDYSTAHGMLLNSGKVVLDVQFQEARNRTGFLFCSAVVGEQLNYSRTFNRVNVNVNPMGKLNKHHLDAYSLQSFGVHSAGFVL